MDKHETALWAAMALTPPAQAHKPIAASLRLFADAENFPILMHCVHGKDRTGLIAMLLLGLLDVEKQARPSRHCHAAHAMD